MVDLIHLADLSSLAAACGREFATKAEPATACRIQAAAKQIDDAAQELKRACAKKPYVTEEAEQ